MYFMLCLVFVFIATFAFNLVNTPPLGSVHTITGTLACFLGRCPFSYTLRADEHATVLTDFASQVPRQDERVAPLSDIPISVVNRILFHPIVEEELPGRSRKAAAARLG